MHNTVCCFRGVIVFVSAVMCVLVLVNADRIVLLALLQVFHYQVGNLSVIIPEHSCGINLRTKSQVRATVEGYYG